MADSNVFSIAQLELPYMNYCPRCEGRWKKCSLCNGTGEISDEIIQIGRLLEANAREKALLERNVART